MIIMIILLIPEPQKSEKIGQNDLFEITEQLVRLVLGFEERLVLVCAF